MTSAIVEISHLTKIFRNFWGQEKCVAVRDLSIEVRPGEIFGLIGPNGSGKTTTLKILLDLLNPTRGKVRLFGFSPSEIKVKERVGFLPEESYLYDFLTAEETLHFFGNLFDLPKSLLKKRVPELLEKVGLEWDSNEKVRTFSKGMTRRLALAQALINDPDLLVLDEPTNGLDPLAMAEFKEIIFQHKRNGKTVILSSHHLFDIEQLCDRVAMIAQGELLLYGSISEILQDNRQFEIHGQAPENFQEDSLTKILQQHGFQEVNIQHSRKSLENVFVETLRKKEK